MIHKKPVRLFTDLDPSHRLHIWDTISYVIVYSHMMNEKEKNKPYMMNVRAVCSDHPITMGSSELFVVVI